MQPPNRIYLIAALLLAAGVALAAGSNGSSQIANYMITVVSKALAKTLSTVQKNSIVSITAAWAKYGDGDVRKLVYMLAIAWHESRLQPIREIKAQPGTAVWEQYQSKYWASGYYGRGYVQLTLKGNYEKMSKFLGVDLVANPELALVPEYAAQILAYGMMNGSFTGQRLSDFINADQADFYNARKTVGSIMVNGVDTAALIEGYAKAFAGQMS